MAKIERFEDLKIWKEAIEIGVKIYELSDLEPLCRDFKSRDQLVGATISISNNIAEGFEYNSNKSFKKFLLYAKGSGGEVRSQLALLERVGRVSDSDYKTLKSDLLILSGRIKAFINYLDKFENKK